MISTTPSPAASYQPFAAVRDWLSSRLFPTDAGSVQGVGARREVGEHLSGHGVQCPVCGSSIQHGANVFQVGLVSRSERQQDVPQNLLNDVQ